MKDEMPVERRGATWVRPYGMKKWKGAIFQSEDEISNETALLEFVGTSLDRFLPFPTKYVISASLMPYSICLCQEYGNGKVVLASFVSPESVFDDVGAGRESVDQAAPDVLSGFFIDKTEFIVGQIGLIVE